MKLQITTIMLKTVMQVIMPITNNLQKASNLQSQKLDLHRDEFRWCFFLSYCCLHAVVHTSAYHTRSIVYTWKLYISHDDQEWNGCLVLSDSTCVYESHRQSFYIRIFWYKIQKPALQMFPKKELNDRFQCLGTNCEIADIFFVLIYLHYLIFVHVVYAYNMI